MKWLEFITGTRKAPKGDTQLINDGEFFLEIFSDRTPTFAEAEESARNGLMLLTMNYSRIYGGHVMLYAKLDAVRGTKKD